MYCYYCQQEVPGGITFCPSCGRELQASSYGAQVEDYIGSGQQYQPHDPYADTYAAGPVSSPRDDYQQHDQYIQYQAQQAPTPYYPPPSRINFSLRALAGSIIGIITLVLILVSITTMGWYHILWEEDTTISEGIYSADISYSFDTEFGLKEGELSVSMSYEIVGIDTNSISDTITFDYDNMPEESEELMPEDSEWIDVAKGTEAIMIAALAIAIVFVALGMIGAFGLLGSFSGRVPPIFGFIAGILVLVAIVYFIGAFPDSVQEDYKDNMQEQMDEFETGPPDEEMVSYSWFLAMIGGFMFFISSAMTIRSMHPRTYPATYQYYSGY